MALLGLEAQSRMTSSSEERFDASGVPAAFLRRSCDVPAAFLRVQRRNFLFAAFSLSDFRIQCFSSSCDLQIFEVCGLDLSFDVTLSSVYLIKIKTAGTGSRTLSQAHINT